MNSLCIIEDSLSGSGFRVHSVESEGFVGSNSLKPSCSRPKRVPDVDSSCRLLIVPPFRVSSRFESFYHTTRKVTCECNEEDTNDDDDGFREMRSQNSVCPPLLLVTSNREP